LRSGPVTVDRRVRGYAAPVILAILAGVIVAGALGWLALTLVRTWHSVKTFTEDVSEASARVSDAAAALDGHANPARSRPPA